MPIGSSRDPTQGAWDGYASNPILSPEGTEDQAGFASVWLNGTSDYHMFYWYLDGSDVGQIGHATSTDGLAWTKDVANNPILTASVSGWDDGTVSVPSVWKENDTWYMIYRGSSGSVYSIGLATASAPEGPWTKYESNPIITGTEPWEMSGAHSYIDHWGIIKVGSTYYLYYDCITGIHTRQTGIATAASPEGPWTKYENNPIFYAGRYCPGVFYYDEFYYLAMPKYRHWENPVEASIELWRSKSPFFTNMEQVRTVYECSTGADTEWDARSLDTPCILTDDIFRNTFPNNQLWMYFAASNDTSMWFTGLTIETDIASALEMR